MQMMMLSLAVMVLVAISGGRLMRRESFRTIIAVVALIGSVYMPAIAFEATRGADAVTDPTVPQPIIDIDGNSKDFGGLACGSIIAGMFERGFEQRKLIKKLTQPVIKGEEKFEWQIGREAGTTYVATQQGANKRVSVLLYFVTSDLLLKFNATSIMYGFHEPLWPPENPAYKGWYGDLWLHFTDDTTNEVVHINYQSRVGDPKVRVKPDNENVRVERIERGKGTCSEWW
jgi:hypothetical protein